MEKPQAEGQGTMASQSERQGAPAPGTKRARRQERAILKQQQLTAVSTRRRREQFVRWGALAVVALVVIGVVAWLALGKLTGDADIPNGLPGPEGGARIAQDVGTLVGQPAPSFILSDADGTSYTVTPGQGRPLVLVSHMGVT